MDKTKRFEMIKAMELIARQVNDECIFEQWLMCGVADGDINKNTTPDELEDYIDDEDFAELMSTFIHVIACAGKHGGLYCDGVVSKAPENQI